MEYARVAEHPENIARNQTIETLVTGLRARGRIGVRPDDTALGLSRIDEYIQFPPPALKSPN
ncbi:MAG: hypothetical protein QF890_18080 [Myxococcota bacterium]|nr:hypothetical protein [Deltaproteobacteria bacterium]MCP4242137.1 hypothetical protein [bacterium]MDP6075212.1 hypothetical protein [Myxococcota bacterium]MDP7075021.1 hypothetical protein [Myxococcota bacterium]MDP7298249.1 hypothetical protein [Myxococcota bacterium]